MFPQVSETIDLINFQNYKAVGLQALYFSLKSTEERQIPN